MNREVLIITNYYPPEIGAASNRIFQLAKGLHNRNFRVSVLTPLPNYPTGQIFDDYKGRFRTNSSENGINVFRLWIYASNSKQKVLRLLAMLSYSASLIWFFLWHKIPNNVIVQSPPLLVAFTCMLFLKRKKRNLILNVSDLWPIAGLELGAFQKNTSYTLLERIEHFNYKRANLILGQSEEILSHVSSLIAHKNILLYRNYPDFNPPEIGQLSSAKSLKLVYAGLLGMAQGIYKLCKELNFEQIELHIYGSGAEQELISAYILNNPNTPIYYHGQLDRKELHKTICNYDIAIIPLLNRIYGSVPSKIFEYSRLGLPLLYFGGGEGEAIVKNHKLGWVAQSGNYKDLNQVLSKINSRQITVDMRKEIQENAIENFDNSKQLDALVNMLYPRL